MNPHYTKPRLRAVRMSLFPTLNNLDEAVKYAQSKFPDSSRNDIYSVLMTFQNTLLNQIEQ